MTLHALPDVASQWGIGEQMKEPERWLTRQITSGRFRARRIGRYWMMTDDDLPCLVNSRPFVSFTKWLRRGARVLSVRRKFELVEKQELNQSDSSLRNRIAAVQAKHLLVRYDRRAWWCQCGDDCLSVEGSHSFHVADAVIEALNLDVAVTYLSVDKLRREFCVEGYYTVEVNDA